MIEIRRTATFTAWMRKLRDSRARARIAIRIDRLAEGNPGDVRPVGGGISELRIDYGPGYRVYYMQKGDQLIVLLCGGDKDSQNTDIRRAREMASEEDREDGA